MHRTRNAAWVEAHRGFESPPLRHLVYFLQLNQQLKLTHSFGVSNYSPTTRGPTSILSAAVQASLTWRPKNRLQASEHSLTADYNLLGWIGSAGSSKVGSDVIGASGICPSGVKSFTASGRFRARRSRSSSRGMPVCRISESKVSLSIACSTPDFSIAWFGPVPTQESTASPCPALRSRSSNSPRPPREFGSFGS
jgi:hypothetical protein